MSSRNFMQLTLEQRAQLLAFSLFTKSASKVANRLQIARQTVYRELKRNTHIIPAKNNPTCKLDCLNTITCFKNKTQKYWFCEPTCNKYLPRVCDKLKVFPYLCNECKKIVYCNLQKRIYDAATADEEASKRRTYSRDEIKVSKQTFDMINAIVSKLVRQGQSIDVIIANNKNITVSKSTIHDWIRKGYMDIKPIDLRRSVRYNTAKTIARIPKISNSNCKLGHKYPDFLAYIKDNPNANIIEVDTVYGKKGDSKRILTIHLKRFHFQFGILINDFTSIYVNFLFNEVKRRLLNLTGSHSLFQAIFDVILTDNGSEFSDLLSLEVDETTGEVMSHVFYCDPLNSQQKGACERNHELIRYISDKGVSIESLNQSDIDLIFSHINSYSRLSINHKTPYQLVQFTFGQVFLDSINIVKVEANNVLLTPRLLSR